ncbi:ribbon-helix-helix domain-containing protein [Marinobacter sp. HL-58]|uniref:ribbon-helix-helix domain-containing protein n=1 Tax=Marinobacter sp. HL-58 TaxID=1479237 RepID=UPI0006DB400C|nr:MAG: hypothetical protein HLUCCO03_08355 [Marinobacter sp. HL-58]
MCKLFVQADSELWVSRTHSLRIDGMVTSIRMENAFWNALTEIAARDGMNLPQMITKLYHESIDAGHDLGNFTSFLRVCAMRYLALQLSGDIPGIPGYPSPPWMRTRSLPETWSRSRPAKRPTERPVQVYLSAGVGRTRISLTST